MEGKHYTYYVFSSGFAVHYPLHAGVLCLCERTAQVFVCDRVCLHVLCMCNRDTCQDVSSGLSVDGSKVVVSVK